MFTRKLLYLLMFILLQGCSSIMPNLGVSNGKLTVCPDSPNCVSSQAEDKHYIEPMVFNGNRGTAHDKVVAVLEATKSANIVVNEEGYIHAEFTSAVFRFVDDVEFYFSAEQEGKVIIDIRSASRVGHSDFGVNRKRMEVIRSKLED